MFEIRLTEPCANLSWSYIHSKSCGYTKPCTVNISINAINQTPSLPAVGSMLGAHLLKLLNKKMTEPIGDDGLSCVQTK